MAVALGYTNNESYIDYIAAAEKSLSTRQKEIKKHVDGILSYHHHKVDIINKSSQLDILLSSIDEQIDS